MKWICSDAQSQKNIRNSSTVRHTCCLEQRLSEKRSFAESWHPWEEKEEKGDEKRLKQGKSYCISSGNFRSLLLLSACRAAEVCMWGWLFLCLPSETAAGAGGGATRGRVPLHAIGLVGWIQCKWHHIFASDLLKSGCDVTAVSSTPLLFFLCPLPPSLIQLLSL